MIACCDNASIVIQIPTTPDIVITVPAPSIIMTAQPAGPIGPPGPSGSSGTPLLSPQSQPAPPSGFGQFQLYVDVNDDQLKCIAWDGTVTTFGFNSSRPE